jgi:zinc protease
MAPVRRHSESPAPHRLKKTGATDSPIAHWTPVLLGCRMSALAFRSRTHGGPTAVFTTVVATLAWLTLFTTPAGLPAQQSADPAAARPAVLATAHADNAAGPTPLTAGAGTSTGATFAARLAQVAHDTTLANGLEVIAVENHSVPLVTLMVVVRTGAFTQEPGQVGVPHLFEHMLFRSYDSDGHSWGQTMAPLDIAGYNGATGDESVLYFITLPSDNAGDGLRALADLVRDPMFRADNLADERHVVFDEINRDNSQPAHQLSDDVEQLVWTTGWPRKNALGDAVSLLGVNRDTLNRIYHRYYVPNNSALVISGDLTAQQAFKLADDRFGHWKRQADPFAGSTPFTIPPIAQPRAIIDEHAGTDVLLRVEWQGPSTGTDAAGTYAADVLSSILNEPGSTFEQHLVDSGLFTACSMEYLTRDHVGPIVLIAHTSIDSAPRALAALTTELRRLDSPGAFTDDELDAARQRRPVEMALLLEHRTQAASEVADFWASAGFPYFMTYADQLNAVTRPQIEAYVRRYLHAPVVLGLLVPPNSGESLRPAVAAFLTGVASSSQNRTPSPTQ